LANGEGINTVLDIIEGKIKQEENRYRGFGKRKATDESWTIFLLLQPKRKYKPLLESFKTYQKGFDADFSTEFDKLDKLFEGVSLIGDYSVKIQDQILAQGTPAKLIVFFIES
jgi:hypothetical protein